VKDDAPVRVLVFHGYLLRGTGSNIYNASLVAALARMGHEVHLLCQDRDPPPMPDGVHVHVPDIGGLLPVYVVDEYEGFEARAFPDLSEAELDRYIEANVAAVRGVVDAAGGVDAALANHLVMGPAILARAELGADAGGPGFAIKVHGSALEYTVKPNPERFLPYAREGTAAGSGVLVGSRHTAESLWEALGDPGLPARTRLGPPGVDTELFTPRPPPAALAALRALAEALGEESGEAVAAGAWGRDPSRATDALERFAAAEGPRVLFVGKLIVSKGIDLLLAAWPLVAAANPGARLLLVGFGEYADAAQDLWRALSGGDLTAAAAIAVEGRAREGGEEEPLWMLQAFLDRLPPGYTDAARAAADGVAFAGRLDHDEVAEVVPACDALVFPSTFPESFGMVAAEAAAAGVLPVSAAHSGLAEVSRELAKALPPEARDLVSFELGEEAVAGIAGRVNGWLAVGAGTREESRRALRETVERLWSWERVARGVLAASTADLNALPEVPER
jgi:glycosyltransferase involved in cell wall biosynthesis